MGFVTARRESILNTRPPTASYRKLLVSFILSAVCLVVSITLMIIDPILIIAKYNTRINYGSPIHRLLSSVSEGVHVHTYLFNVTNADRFLTGEDHKLKVQEVGPFTYREMRTNEDLELDLANGVMRYTPRTDAIFIPEESIGYPELVNVTMPNIAMLSVTGMLSNYPFLTRVGFNLLQSKSKSKSFVNMDARTFMWGYDEPLITLGNNFMPHWITFGKMGIMDRMYDKNVENRLEVGATSSDKFRIKKLNSCKGLPYWDYEDPTKRSKCNTFKDAYEGIAYHPEMTPDSKVRIFRNVLCRMLELDFVEKRTMDIGSDALVYTINLNKTFRMNPSKECLCGKGMCREGISDISPCFYGLPLAISPAHFLDGPPELFERIEGLKPDPKKHGSEFHIEPKIGMVLKTAFSIQVNVVLNDVTFNAEASQFSDMVVPIAYFTIVAPELNEKQISDLKLMYIKGPQIFLAVEIILFLIGLVLMAYFVRLIYWNWLCSDGRGMAFKLPTDGKKQKQHVITRVEEPLITNERN